MGVIPFIFNSVLEEVYHRLEKPLVGGIKIVYLICHTIEPLSSLVEVSPMLIHSVIDKTYIPSAFVKFSLQNRKGCVIHKSLSPSA